MAIDLQRLMGHLPTQGGRSGVELGERNEGRPVIGTGSRFESILERAETRRLSAEPGASRPRQTSTQSSQAKRSPASSSKPEQSSQNIIDKEQERPAIGEQASKNEKVAESDRAKPSASEESEDQKKSERGQPAEILLAAVVSPLSAEQVAALVAQPNEDGSVSSEGSPAEAAESTVEAVSSVTAPTAVEQGHAGPILEGEETEAQANLSVPGQAGEVKASENKAEKRTEPLVQPMQQEPANHDEVPAELVNRVEEEPAQPIEGKMTVPTMKMAEQKSEAAERPSQEAPQAAVALSGAESTESGRHHSFEPSQEQPQHDLLNQPPGDQSAAQQARPDEGTMRTSFQERMAVTNQPATIASDGLSAGEATGNASVRHAAAAERVSELRESTSFSQSVTLDLDPLDMGPLRLRVMMSDQTVHAHIRTEHGALGHGLLQQGPSLESSLRTTGLEMGMLRVTVDQQQGGGQQAWEFQQQARSGGGSGRPTGSKDEDRQTRATTEMYGNGRVSIFA